MHEKSLVGLVMYILLLEKQTRCNGRTSRNPRSYVEEPLVKSIVIDIWFIECKLATLHRCRGTRNADSGIFVGLLQGFEGLRM